MKVFLTGGTGYLGGHVARALLDAGHEVSALVRDPESAAALVGCGATLVPGDVTQRASWDAALSGSEALVHTAGVVLSWAKDVSVFHRVNVEATLDLVDRAREVGVETSLVASSLFAIGPSPVGTLLDEAVVGGKAHPLTQANHYVHTKRMVTEQLWSRQQSGHGVSLVFPTILIGPGPLTAGNHTATVLSDIGRGRLPGLMGNGEQIWNLVPVENAARGFVNALERGKAGENYILGGENWTQRKLVSRAAHHFQRKAPLRPLGRRLPLAIAGLSEFWTRISGQQPYLTRGAVHLYDADWAFSSDKAVREIGFEPGSVEETVRATTTWLRDEVWSR